MTWVLVVSGMSAVGCGDDDGTRIDCSLVMTPTNLSAPVISLTREEMTNLCDTTACKFGGYGAKLSCSGGIPVEVSDSREDCFASAPKNPACTATVGDFLRCMDAVRASPCASTFLGSAECSAITNFSCLTFRANSARFMTSASVSEEAY